LRCPNPGPRRVVPGPAFPPLWRRQHVGFHLHGAEAGSAIQTWKIFLRNHVVASIDLFVVPTIAYQQLFGRCHVVECLMRVRRVSQQKSCGGDDFAPRLHG
jgi:hypothetical protein